MATSKKIVICDLDNTLYDWVTYFVEAFYAMSDAAAGILSVSADSLLDELKKVHQKHHDSEHPFALLETETVNNLLHRFSREKTYALLKPAFDAYSDAAATALKPYPNVIETLQALNSTGHKLVAYSEAKSSAILPRVIQLGILDYFDEIVCRKSTPLLSWHSSHHVDLHSADVHSKLFELPIVHRKPSPETLLQLCAKHAVAKHQAIYVGDSLSRDILMARSAGISSAWARYGNDHPPGYFQQLVRVSHWSSDDIEREIALQRLTSKVSPDYTLKKSFGELCTYL
jgi:FMN phosphatase YigB (HAD superfamily)